MVMYRTYFVALLLGLPLFLVSQASLPVYEPLETGMLDSSFWTVRPNLEGEGGIIEVLGGSYASLGNFGVRMGKSRDTPGQFALNAIDLNVDLANKVDVILEFRIIDFGDETNPQG